MLVTSASGGGKTKFLSCVAGLLPLHEVTSGLFVRSNDRGWDGVPYARYAQERKFFNNFGFVFQDAINSLHPYRSVRRQLEHARRFRDDPIEPDLATFRLTELDLLQVDRFRYALSGGQCQRVSLLLASDSVERVVLLDEPLTDIDATSREKIVELLIERFFAVDSQSTVVLVSHNAEWLDRPEIKAVRHFVIGTREEFAEHAKDPEIFLSQVPAGASILYEKFGSDSFAPDLSKLTPSVRTGGSVLSVGLDDGARLAPILSLDVKKPIVPGAATGFRLWPFALRDDVSEPVTIRRGEGVALYGLSGSGKSLLLRSIAGLWVQVCYELYRTQRADGLGARYRSDRFRRAEAGRSGLEHSIYLSE